MSTIDEDRLTVFSDYVCPFCYLGKAAMEEYLGEAEDPPEVEWHVFDLRGYKRNPDGSIDHDVDDGKDDEYFEQVRENVERLKDQYDVDMTLDYSLDVDSWNAQKVALYVEQAYDEETFAEFHERTFEALWREGRDIGDPDVLAAVAADAGADPDEVREAAADEAVRTRVREQFEEASRRAIMGVPTFAYEGQVARGAVPPDHLQGLVEGT